MFHLTLNSLAITLPMPEVVMEAMPLFPGKLFFFILVGISMVTWSIIISKSFQFDRIRKSDANFKKRLRDSDSCLEVYEKGEEFPNSPLFMVYEAGAKTSALEMVGSSSQKLLSEKQLTTEGTLDINQIDLIGEAFERGQKAGLDFLRDGIRPLGMLATLAAIAGLIASACFMTMALNAYEYDFNKLLFYCLTVLVTSMLVAIPAGCFRFHLQQRLKKQGKKLTRFREKLDSAFKSHLQVSSEPPSREAIPVENKTEIQTNKPEVIPSERETIAPAPAPQMPVPSAPIVPPEAFDPSIQQETRMLQEETKLLHEVTAALHETTNDLQQETQTLQEETRSLRENSHSIREEVTSLHQNAQSIQDDAKEIKENLVFLNQEAQSLQQETNLIEKEDGKSSRFPPTEPNQNPPIDSEESKKDVMALKEAMSALQEALQSSADDDEVDRSGFQSLRKHGEEKPI